MLGTEMRLQTVLPVLVSITVIILVAVLEKQSKAVAAITATMPVNVTLGLFIVYVSNDGEQATMEDFSRGLLFGIVPTLGFLLAAWFAARAGLKLVPTLLVGYAVWGVGVGAILMSRRLLGV